MGFRFRKSKKIAPGVRLNFGKKGVGVRFGGKGGGISFGPSGTRVSASIPGTGISYSSKLGGKKHKKTSSTPKNVRPKNTKPVPLRVWYLIVAALFLIGGLGCLATDFSTAIVALIIFALMAFGTYTKFKVAKRQIEQKEQAIESETISVE